MKTGVSWLSEQRPGMTRLFYFTSPSHALENLKRKLIKVSNFTKCNDLFELASIDLSNKGVREAHSVWLKQVSNVAGLICFSEDWRSTLMWGYYTNNGEGICLVLDVLATELSPVKYVPKRTEILQSGIFPSRGATNFREFCSVKSHHWSHEREQRFFVNLEEDTDLKSVGGLQFIEFGERVQLAGIINGPKPYYSRKDLLGVTEEDIGYFQCRPAFREFTMVMQQTQRLWR